MYINIETLVAKGFNVSVQEGKNGEPEGVIIEAQNKLHLDWQPMHKQLAQLEPGLSAFDIDDAVSRFTVDLELRQIIKAIKD